jgi:hypothetical protein
MTEKNSGYLSRISQKTLNATMTFGALKLLEGAERNYGLSERAAGVITQNLDKINEIRNVVGEYLRSQVTPEQWSRLADSMNTVIERVPGIRDRIGNMVQTVGDKVPTVLQAVADRVPSSVGETGVRVLPYLQKYTSALSLNGSLSLQSIVASFVLLYTVEKVMKRRPLMNYFLKYPLILTTFIVYAIPVGGVTSENIVELTTNVISTMLLFLAACNLLDVVSLAESIISAVVSGIVGVCTGIISLIGNLGTALLEFFDAIGARSDEEFGGGRKSQKKNKKKLKRRTKGGRR